jgi:hypothetical protein
MGAKRVAKSGSKDGCSALPTMRLLEATAQLAILGIERIEDTGRHPHINPRVASGRR